MLVLRSGDVALRTQDGGKSWSALTSMAAIANASHMADYSWTGKTLVLHGADQHAPYNDFDIILDHFSRTAQLHRTPHAPCAMIYLVPILIGCGLTFRIQCCDQFGASGTAGPFPATSGSRLTTATRGSTRRPTWSRWRCSAGSGTRAPGISTLPAAASSPRSSSPNRDTGGEYRKHQLRPFGNGEATVGVSVRPTDAAESVMWQDASSITPYSTANLKWLAKECAPGGGLRVHVFAA